jgi:NADPH-dependent curcumin reductase CurA
MTSPPMTSQWRMTRYRTAETGNDIFELTHDDPSPVREGEVAVRFDWISVDPAMSGWTTNKRSYMPPVKPGQIMRAFGIGEVIESCFDGLNPGDWVTGFTGMQTDGVLPGKHLRKVDISLAAPNHYLSWLGMTGYTGYFGMSDIGRPGPGKTVVVSAAAGAVGSIAAQVAHIAGARVIGIAGGPVKYAYLTEELRLDSAIDYKGEDVEAALRRECPDGIDIYFDNVGGAILDAVLAQINYHGTIIVCGAISQYGDWHDAKGPKNYLSLITQSAKMQGFTMKDYYHRIPEAVKALVQMKEQGQLIFREHIVEGIENFPDAFETLFTGEKHGKLLIKVR